MGFGCVPTSRRKMMALASLAGMAATLLVAFSSPAEAARRRHHRAAGGGYNPPYADMVVDVKTGRILHAQNEDALRHPASITKVMTLFLLFEQLEKGRIDLDTPLRVSEHASRQAPSKLGLEPGETIAVEDAIKALVTKSANDVAVAVAENLAGSEDAFAEQMTRRARSLGMTRTVYRNASGLPDPEQVTTARDLTILARAIQERFPRHYRYFQTRMFNYAGASHRNHNRLLGRIEGVDGIKTGYTRASGFNLMTNVRTEDRHIVAVVLGGRSGASRDQIMVSLVRANLPRAYAGLRTAPAATEVPERSRPVLVADASDQPPASSVEGTASVLNPMTTGARAAGKPLDLNALRPVVASAAGASSTTTPTSRGLRWSTGAQPVPQNAQGYAPSGEPAARPASNPAPASKVEERLAAVSPAPSSKAETSEKREPGRSAAASAWVIQIGATDDEDKAKSILEQARSRSGRALAHASAFTEKVSQKGSTLYRARFSGFEEAEQAQDACKALKRSGFACFATRS